MMQYRSLSRLLMLVTLAWPAHAHAQSKSGDRLWNGMLIGAGVGASVGMLIAPPAFCGTNDSECATIVRVAIGLPAIAGGVGIGALVDGLHKRDSAAAVPPSPRRGPGATGRPRLSGVQMTVRF
jgi:hypothetical protein